VTDNPVTVLDTVGDLIVRCKAHSSFVSNLAGSFNQSGEAHQTLVCVAVFASLDGKAICRI
jgi:hypothetical protein